MSRLFKIAAAVGIGIALIFLVTLSVLYHLIQSGELRAYAISEIEKQTGAQVKVGETNLSLGRVVGISFADFALLDPETAQPVMTAQKVPVQLGKNHAHDRIGPPACSGFDPKAAS